MEIHIPSKKNIAVIAVSFLWLFGWFYGEYNAYNTIINSSKALFADVFILVWFTIWTVAGFFVIHSVLWSLLGEEIISIDRGSLIVSKKIIGFGFPKSYEINSIRNLRVDIEQESSNWKVSNQRSFLGTEKGNIKFDYGMETIKFGSEIAEVEAKYILEKFKANTKFKESNF